MVVFGGYERRIVFELVTPCVSDIHIDWVAISVKFPYARNRNVIPTFVVEAGFPEVGRSGIGILYPVEFPRAVQCHEVGGVFLDALLGCLGRFVSKVIGMHRGAVYRIDSRVFPFLEGLCSQGECHPGEQTCEDVLFHKYKIRISFDKHWFPCVRIPWLGRACWLLCAWGWR